MQEQTKQAIAIIWRETNNESFGRIINGRWQPGEFVCAYRILFEDVEKLEDLLKELHRRVEVKR
jgi:hypothetical protein